ncbi:MAG: glycosyltransferase [Proteobacteria bacterium]|nr:glycosyltransferase [Pseudomonadota bacterium]
MAVGFFTIRWAHLYAHITADRREDGSHKIHKAVVPRIGGVGIFVGWLVALGASVAVGALPGMRALTWVAAVSVVFAAGLAEDLSKKVRPRDRLLAALLSALLGAWLLDASLNRFDNPVLDFLFVSPLMAMVVTAVAVGGVAHAVNVIDGLNGLAGSICLMALASLGYVAVHVGDSEIMLMALLGFGALLGFFIWNYPSGQIFSGDGGAYFLGIYIAMLSVLLVRRHDEVSAWFPLMLMAYPVWETLFSVYRRRVRGQSSATADRLHLHTLLYRRLPRWISPSHESGGGRLRRNSDASALLMLLAGANGTAAVLFWDSTPILLTAAGVFIVVYLTLYGRLVRYKFRRQRVPQRSIQVCEGDVAGQTPPPL